MIVVDIETTGLSPRKNSIISIGALDFHNPENQFYAECQIFEGAEITEQALQINGFTKEQITDKNKKTLSQAMEDFIEWADKTGHKIFAGHNHADFDLAFLRNSAYKYNLKLNASKRTVDLHALCFSEHIKAGLNPYDEENNSIINTDKALGFVGLPPEPKPHNALTGTKMEAEAFSRLLYGKNLLPEFRDFPIPKELQK